MNSPNTVILQWTKKHRPDLVDHISHIFQCVGPNYLGLQLLLCVGFAAGRAYQKEHPTLDLSDYHE